MLAELEARLLLSASPVPEAAVDVDANLTADEPQQVTQDFTSTGSDATSTDHSQGTYFESQQFYSSELADPRHAAEQAQQTTRQELVFVDTRVQDYQQLVNALLNNQVDDRNIRVVLLEPESSLADVTAVLADSRDLDALHFISHGNDGVVMIGQDWLVANHLGEHAQELERWGAALSEHADVLIYGCDVAQTELGRQFLDELGRWTGSDVAASTDRTGHSTLGGDWDLEFSTGAIETAGLFNADRTAHWVNLLPVAPSSSVIALNQTTSNVQKGVDVALFANGSFVAVWDSLSDGSGEGVYGRIFNSSGSPVANEFRINQTTLNQQVDPAIALSANGNFVVAWTSTQGGSKDIYARVYNSSGTPLTNEILVNAGSTTGDQQNPDVAVDDSGNFIVVWELEGPGDSSGVFGQRLFANGTLNGGLFRINSTTVGNQDNASVAMGPTGDFVVTWTDRGGSNPRIAGQRFNSSGAGQGEFAVQAVAVGEADLSSVAMDDSGKFVVTWGEKNADSSQYGIRMRRFNADNTAITGDVLVNTTTAADQFDPAVAIDTDGDFVIAWTSANQDGNANGVIARAFRSDGTPDSAGELLVNTYTTGDQHVSQVAINDSGKFVVGWQGQSAADSAGVYGRTYSWTEAASNVKPVVALPAGPVNYTLGDPLTIIDATATVTDPDSANFDSGTLTVSITSNASLDDRLEIRDGGTIRLSGNVIEWKSAGPFVVIGTFAGGSDGFTPLVISLNANADSVKTQDLIRSIGYRNVSTTAPTHSVLVQVVLSDGDGAASTPQSETVSIQGVNQGPTNSVPGDQSTFVDTPLEFSTAGGNLISTSDPDAGSSLVQVTLSATNGTLTLNLGGGQADPVAAEQLTNSTTTNTQSEPAIARAPNGNYVVVWSGYRNAPNPAEILFQLYDAGGNPIGGQRIANSTTPNTQSDPDVAMDQNGNFVIVWTSVGQDNADGKHGVYGQRFDSAGNTLGGEFLVNTVTNDHQNSAAVAIDASGNFVVTWADQFLDGSGEGIFAQRFSSTGARVGGHFQVNTYTTGKQLNPDVAMDAGGNFVITWDSAGQDFGDGQSGIYARRYDANGVALSGEIPVNTTLPKEQSLPSIAMTAAGDYIIVWTSKDNDGSARGIFGQMFDSTGNPVGPTEFQVNTTAALDQRNGTVTVDANGNFAVVWESINQDNPGDMLTGVYLQQFDKTGARIGGERLVNSTVSGVQGAPVAAMDGDGDIVIAWHGNGAGDASGVFHRRYENAAELSFMAGDGAADSTMTFTASLSAVNDAMDGMRFTPTAGFVGLATVTVTTNDLGNTGSGGAKQDSDSVNINVLERAGGIGSVTDQNATANEVNENAGNGTAVGITAHAVDPNSSDTVSYTLDDDAGGRFSINVNTGVVIVADGTLLDYEAATSHEITVRATSTDASFSTRAFTITLLPVNDHAPVFTSNGTPSINENQTLVQTLTATDSDLPAQSITFAITGGLDAAKFVINGANQLAFTSTPDFEIPTDSNLDNVYEVEVTANDGNGALTPTLIRVSVNDVIEGNVLVVDTTNDVVDGNVTTIGALLTDRGADGRISLREAILAANNTANGSTPDEIRFGIPDVDAGHLYYRDDAMAGSLSMAIATAVDDASILDFDPDYPYTAHSWFRINLNPAAGQLSITDAVIIDGYSQSGALQNTLSVGHNGVLRIELTSVGPDGHHGIHVAAGGTGTAIRGLAIHGFDWSGILTDPGADGVTIQGNFIGTDITGTLDQGNGDAGVQLQSSDNLIGGSNLESRNVISANDGGGIVTHTFGPMATGNVITNNYVGVDSTGLRALGNETVGIQVWNQDGIQIQSNVISGNNGDGIWLRSGSTHWNTVIQSNWIGTGADGNSAVANADDGIQIDSGASNTTIGGLLSSQINVIRYNGDNGIEILGGAGSTIRGNSILENGGLAIDIVGSSGVDANDAGDSDAGPNMCQNYPVLATAIVSGTSITITGTLNSTPNVSGMLIDFYWSPTSDNSLHGEAAAYIGSTTVNTDANGDASFSVHYAGASVPLGGFVTATATDLAGNTSEFGRNVTASSGNTAPRIVSAATPAIAENQNTVYVLTAIDSDLPAQTISFAITGGADAGHFTINGANELEFVAAPDFESPLDFFSDNVYQVEVTANDGHGGTDSLLISVTVTPVNDNTPVITSPNTVNVAENTTGVLTVTGSDADLPVQVLTYSISGGPDAALFSINAVSGALSFQNAPDFEAPADFDRDNVYQLTIQVSDGTWTDIQPVAITVMNVNDPPVASSDSYTVSEDTPLLESALTGVLANDSDAEGDLLTAVLVSGPGHAGFFSLNSDGSFAYVPRADFSGGDVFTYRAGDGTGDSNVVTVFITVTPVNDAPVAAADRYTVAQDTAIDVAASGVLRNDSDVDGPAMSANLVNGPANGTLLLAADGSFRYTPAPGFVGMDSFTYRAEDGSASSVMALVTIRVTAAVLPFAPAELPAMNIDLPAAPDITPLADQSPMAEKVEPVSPAPAQQGAERSIRSPSQSDARSVQVRVSAERVVSPRSSVPSSEGTLSESTLDHTVSRGGLVRSQVPGSRRTIVSNDLKSILEPDALWQDLNTLRQQLHAHGHSTTIAVASVITSTIGLSVGYVVWLLRGGILVSSLLSSMPAWRLIDPLPILESLEGAKRSDEDDESLQSIIQSADTESAALASTDTVASPN